MSEGAITRHFSQGMRLQDFKILEKQHVINVSSADSLVRPMPEEKKDRRQIERKKEKEGK